MINKLWAVKERYNFTGAQLEEILGIKRPSFYMVKRGERNFTPQQEKRIEDFVNNEKWQIECYEEFSVKKMRKEKSLSEKSSALLKKIEQLPEAKQKKIITILKCLLYF